MPERTTEGVTHRPLPSVGIPLLRDELRASRVRRIVLIAVASALGIGAIVAAVVLPNVLSASASEGTAPAAAAAPDQDELEAQDEAPAEEEAPEAPPAAALTVSEEPLPHGEGTRTVRRFGDARGFRPALTGAGMSGADADAVIAALDDVMDFRRCRPDHEMVLERAADGRVSRFEYRASVTSVYEAVRQADGNFAGRQLEVPIERIRIRRGGVVRTSLGSALEEAGLGRTMVGVFVEVFDGVVNFNTHTRAGDTFRIIVDEERVGGEFLRWGTVHAVEVRGQRLGERRAYWFEPRDDMADFFDETGRAVHGGWLRTPLRFDHISSPFNPRRMHPILRRIVPHNGVDYAAATGTPIVAAANGTVAFVGPRGANGNLVSLRHENGYETHYAHLSRFAPGLARGQTVRQRQLIGYVGSTGRSTGPHLHFGLAHHGRFVDPQAELNGPGRMMPSTFLGRYRRHMRELATELDAIALEAPAPVPAAPAPAEPAAPSDEVMD
jgi:murein DD-endopeptidase MepM/ murein hydrolase activator NlpD